MPGAKKLRWAIHTKKPILKDVMAKHRSKSKRTKNKGQKVQVVYMAHEETIAVRSLTAQAGASKLPAPVVSASHLPWLAQVGQIRRAPKVLGETFGHAQTWVLRTAKRVRHQAAKHSLLAFGAVALLFLPVVIAAGAFGHTAVHAASVVNHSYDQPVTITFARPLKASGLKYAWQESIEGTWQKKHGWGGVTALVFTPKGVLPPGATLHAKLQGVRPLFNIASSTPASQTIAVSIQKAPGLGAVVPATAATEVAIDAVLSVQLTAPNRSLRQLELVGAVPVLSKKPMSSNDKVFRWALAAQLEQGKMYTAEVVDRNQPAGRQHFATFTFTTVKEPHASSDTGRTIRPGDSVTLDFDLPMVQDPKIVSLNMPGSGAWVSESQYRIQVGDVKPGKTYSYTVAKGAKSKAGGFFTNEQRFEISTPGAVQVAGAQPSGTRIALNAPVKLTFNQPVDHASAEKAFNITPNVSGSFSWSGNTLVFTPAGYSYQTTYTYGVAAGITPVFGLPGVAYGNRFVTQYEIRKLAVPYFRQAHALSCEAASLRMALAYRGVATNDDAILGLIGYNPQPRDTASNTWQDPNIEFVGNVDGKMNVTGWGVYAAPVARASRALGRNAEVIYSPSSQSVAAAIYAGHPVVVWGSMGAPVDDSWNTATSGVVHAAKNQHVRLAYGVEGSPDDPVGFYLQDPLRGSVYVTAGALQVSMNGGGRQILVVY